MLVHVEAHIDAAELGGNRGGSRSGCCPARRAQRDIHGKAVERHRHGAGRHDVELWCGRRRAAICAWRLDVERPVAVWPVVCSAGSIATSGDAAAVTGVRCSAAGRSAGFSTSWAVEVSALTAPCFVSACCVPCGAPSGSDGSEAGAAASASAGRTSLLVPASVVTGATLALVLPLAGGGCHGRSARWRPGASASLGNPRARLLRRWSDRHRIRGDAERPTRGRRSHRFPPRHRPDAACLWAPHPRQHHQRNHSHRTAVSSAAMSASAVGAGSSEGGGVIGLVIVVGVPRALRSVGGRWRACGRVGVVAAASAGAPAASGIASVAGGDFGVGAGIAPRPRLSGGRALRRRIGRRVCRPLAAALPSSSTENRPRSTARRVPARSAGHGWVETVGSGARR